MRDAKTRVVLVLVIMLGGLAAIGPREAAGRDWDKRYKRGNFVWHETKRSDRGGPMNPVDTYQAGVWRMVVGRNEKYENHFDNSTFVEVDWVSAECWTPRELCNAAAAREPRAAMEIGCDGREEPARPQDERDPERAPGREVNPWAGLSSLFIVGVGLYLAKSLGGNSLIPTAGDPPEAEPPPADGTEVAGPGAGPDPGAMGRGDVSTNSNNLRDPSGLDAGGAGAPRPLATIPRPARDFTLQNADCFRYALNDPAGPKDTVLIRAFDQNMPMPAEHMAKDLSQSWGLYTEGEKIPPGCWKVAVVQDGGDWAGENWAYHFYRQEKSGYWTHKPGKEAISAVDGANEKITDPRKVTEDPKRNQGYGVWGGYLYVPPGFDIDAVLKGGPRT